MEAVPYYNTILLCIIPTVCRYQNVVGCVVWTRAGGALCDASTHCDVPGNIYNGSVTSDVASPSPGLWEAEASLTDKTNSCGITLFIHYWFI
ncbi:unnamed protein product [Lota lota]